MESCYWRLSTPRGLWIASVMLLLGPQSTEAQEYRSTCHDTLAIETIQRMAYLQELWSEAVEVHSAMNGDGTTPCVVRRHQRDRLHLPQNAMASRTIMRIAGSGIVAIECWNVYSPTPPAYRAAYSADGDIFWLRGFPGNDWPQLYHRLRHLTDSASLIQVAELYVRTVVGDMPGRVNFGGVDTSLARRDGRGLPPHVAIGANVTEIEIYTWWVNRSLLHRHRLTIGNDGQVTYEREALEP